jgi:hypothetical protein
MEPTLREIAEGDALSLILGSVVTNVEIFPSKDIGAIIIRYDNGKVVWVKYKKDETGMFINKWYVPAHFEEGVEKLPPVAFGKPSLEPLPSDIEDPEEEDDYVDAMTGTTDTPSSVVDVTDEYVNIRSLDINDPVVRAALKYVDQNELIAGKMKKSAMERARRELNPATSTVSTANPSLAPKRNRARVAKPAGGSK